MSTFFFQAIAVCCIGLHYKSITNNFNADSLSVTAFGGYIIILVGGFAGKIRYVHAYSIIFNKSNEMHKSNRN